MASKSNVSHGGSYTLGATDDGSKMIHCYNFTGTLWVSASGVVSSAGAPPPGVSPFTIEPEPAAPPAGASTREGEAAAASAPSDPAVTAADLITADWGVSEEQAGASRPVAKRSRNSNGSLNATSATENVEIEPKRMASRRAPARTSEGGSVAAAAPPASAQGALSRHVLPAGSLAEDEGSATFLGASWVNIDAGCLGSARPSPRWGLASACVDDQRLVFYGGQDSQGVVRGDTWSLDTASAQDDAWVCRVDDADSAAGGAGGASPRMWHSLVAIPERNILVTIGKIEGSAPSSELEIDVFDTSIDLWCASCQSD